MKKAIQPKSYRFTVHSLFRVISALSLLMSINFILILNNLPNWDNLVVDIVLFLAVYILSFYLAHLIGKGRVKIIVTEAGITHLWEKHFIFNKENTFTIPWERVVSFNDKTYTYFDKIEINLTNQLRYKQFRLNVMLNNDDFKSFKEDFPRLQKTYQSNLKS